MRIVEGVLNREVTLLSGLASYFFTMINYLKLSKADCNGEVTVLVVKGP